MTGPEIWSALAAVGSVAAFIISTIAVYIARISWKDAHRLKKRFHFSVVPQS